MEYTMEIDLENENGYVRKAYETACKHGFHDEYRPDTHWLMLVITEISEAVEADRKGKRAQVAMFNKECNSPQPEERVNAHWQFCFEQFIKDTVEDEFADICIRLYDYAGLIGARITKAPAKDAFVQWLEAFGELSFTQLAFILCRMITTTTENKSVKIARALSFVRCWAKHWNVDLQRHIELKMRYNAERPVRHGKQY